MKPFTAILRKEFHQQGALALAMVLVCVLVQMVMFIMASFPEVMGQVTPEYFAAAVFLTALFAGSAAAISFSGEQDEQTFGFLRSLPVASKTVFFSKTLWLVAATLLVGVGSLLSASLWGFAGGGTDPNGAGSFDVREIVELFGIAILEAFAWGLFWSTRCKSQIHALLATYFSTSTVAYLAAMTAAHFSYDYIGGSFANFYGNAAWLRLGIVALVGVFAVRGGLRWFDFWVQKKTPYDPTGEPRRNFFAHLPFPRRVYSPFFSLFHQTIRQSQTMLLIAVTLGFGCLFLFFGPRRLVERFSFVDTLSSLIAVGAVIFYFIYCGSIFAADQKNNSYRLLSRCGIAPGKVWWSRVLPFALPTLLLLFALVAGMVNKDIESSAPRAREIHGFWMWCLMAVEILRQPEWLYFGLPLLVGIWMIPFAVGTLLSISVQRPIIAIALTGAAGAAVYFWMGMGVFWFGFSPLLTTLPLCLAMMLASRLRAADWLRERRDWRSRLKSLSPIFVTVIVMLLAIPPYRVYSVPFYSLSQVEDLLDRTDLPERLSPEERQKLFRETEARLHTPFSKASWLEIRDTWYFEWHPEYAFNRERHERYPELEDWKSLSRLQQLRIGLEFWKRHAQTFPTFEEWLLKEFELKYRMLETVRKTGASDEGDNTDFALTVYRFLPWEKARSLRRFRCQLVLGVEDTGRFGERWPNVINGKAEKELDSLVPEERQRLESYRYDNAPIGLFDEMSNSWLIYAPEYYFQSARSRMRMVAMALEIWHLEHEGSLPESLDELVEAGLLDAIPTGARMGERMIYVSTPDEKLIEENRNRPGYFFRGNKPGWPHLILDGNRYDLQFLPGYEEYGKTAPGEVLVY